MRCRNQSVKVEPDEGRQKEKEAYLSLTRRGVGVKDMKESFLVHGLLTTLIMETAKLMKVVKSLPGYTVLHPRRQPSSDFHHANIKTYWVPIICLVMEHSYINNVVLQLT